jgi:hemoglobin-like flavoprotein
MNYTELFNDSFERNIATNEEAFFQHFYEVFLSQSEQVRNAFKDIDMEQQHKMMKVSLLVLVNFHCSGLADEHIRHLAHVHGERKISAKLYQQWMDALIQALETYDPKHTDDVSLAWQKTLGSGIQYMKTASQTI